jgi:hypothetical protein
MQSVQIDLNNHCQLGFFNKALVKFEENVALKISLFALPEIVALIFALASSSDLLFRVLDDPAGERGFEPVLQDCSASGRRIRVRLSHCAL